MERLFTKYPTIFYSGLQCRDLSRRIQISSVSRRNPNLFYPVTLKAGLRADSLADAYYEDAELDWLIWFSNDVTDTYFDWYLDEAEFNDFIKQKYGTIEYAVKKTIYWRANWHADDTEIPPGIFNNNIAMDDRRYYKANFGEKEVLSYSRRPEDWLVATNRILKYDLTSYVSGNSFTAGEIIDIEYPVTNPVGGAEVVTSNSSALVVNHVVGDSWANSSVVKTMRGETSGSVAETNKLTSLAEVITNADARFWGPVSYYDWENEKNQARKDIKVMAKFYAARAAEEFRQKLK